MKVLLAASECDPFVKVGGLGDVVSALSVCLKKLGHDVRVVLPKYKQIKCHPECHAIDGRLIVTMGYGREYAKVFESRFQDVTVYFIEFDRYFFRDGVYGESGNGYGDNWERFAFFSRAVIDMCDHISWSPDIIHANDWPTGLIPAFLAAGNVPSTVRDATSVYTIHNLAHQGWSPNILLEFADLPNDYYRRFSVYGCNSLNIMKGALQFAKKITTVSKRYAEEIKTPEFGCGLDGDLRYRANDLIGILNGIDTDAWNPETDRLIPQNFSAKSMSGKIVCKTALQKQICLPVDQNIPIFGVISRFFKQKGLDLLADILPKIAQSMAIQFIILGSGEQSLEEKFSTVAGKYPKKIAIKIGYDNSLAHSIEAGSDFFVMPSRYEPCGLNQMYSMRYGTLPIVHYVGGLADTVENYDQSSGTGTGFVLYDLKRDSLFNTIKWACSMFFERKDDIERMRTRAMKKDFSWEQSARSYVDVYKSALNKQHPTTC